MDEKLAHTLKSIEKELKRGNSGGRKFMLGIMTGFGTVIGATILVTLAVSILSLLSHFGIFPNFIDWIVETIS